MKFTKMHGLGNDYIYVNCLKEQADNPSELAVRLSDRHFGIGADGLILIKPSDEADFEMDMYNADGSSGKMCGNGIRCVAKYVYDKGLTDQTSLAIKTGSGIKRLELTVENGKTKLVRVNMGTPEFRADRIPAIADTEEIINEPFWIDGREYPVTCVSMGNPHCVTFIKEDVGTLHLAGIGPFFENHKRFPDRINAEFVNVVDRKTLRMRVWERGSGETLACGTGACATAVAAIVNGLADEEVTVRLSGGDLLIRWDRKADQVYMTGPATTVFEGEI